MAQLVGLLLRGPRPALNNVVYYMLQYRKCAVTGWGMYLPTPRGPLGFNGMIRYLKKKKNLASGMDIIASWQLLILNADSILASLTACEALQSDYKLGHICQDWNLSCSKETNSSCERMHKVICGKWNCKPFRNTETFCLQNPHLNPGSAYLVTGIIVCVSDGEVTSPRITPRHIGVSWPNWGWKAASVLLCLPQWS